MESYVHVRAAARLRKVLVTTGVALAGIIALPAGVAVASAATSASPTAEAAATYTGLGLDNCGLPTVAQLSAWTKAKSPYKSINVYIGGVNAACTAKLSPAWVKGVTKLGWGLIPTYVGLQAPQPNCPCAGISLTKAYSEGVAAAKDAVTIMSAGGIGKGNPIYDDMEGYTRGKPNTPAVRTFLRAWTVELHKLGYVSGIYAGADTGVRDLVAVYGTSYPEPDDIWIADWNGQHSTSDPNVPAADWANHQRLHQFSGESNLTYGGVTFSGADGDYCDGAVVSASTL